MASNATTIASNIANMSSIVTTISSNLSEGSNSHNVCYRLELLSFQPTQQGMISVILSSILGAIISVVATTMNTLTLYVLYLFPNLQSTTNLLLVSLSVLDLLVGGTAIPFSIAARVAESMKIHMCWLQSLSTFSTFLLTPFSVFAICFITIDRYIALFYPNSYRQPRLRRIYLIAMSIVASVWLAFISLLTYFVGLLNTKVLRACIAGLLICFLLFVSFCYLKIARRLKVHCKTTDQSAATIAVPRNQALKRQFKVMTTLVSVFLACHFPKLITMMMIVMGTSFEIVYIATQWSDLSVYLNSALNPFMYMWRIQEIRRAILTVTGCLQREEIQITVANDRRGDLD